MQQHASIVITFCKIQVILIDKYVVVYADKVLNNIVLITLHRKEIRWWHFHSLGNLIYIRFHNVHNVQIDLQRTDQLIVDIVKKKTQKNKLKIALPLVVHILLKPSPMTKASWFADSEIGI